MFSFILHHQQRYRSTADLHDTDGQNVESTVYYFANSLDDIDSRCYSFSNDQPRATMIFKWMKFYCYHPGLSKEVDKPRRDELKDHLNLPLGFGQRLSTFIIRKFHTFKRWGLISEDATNLGIKYHAVTDMWLSQTWDGNIEQSRLALSHDKQSPGPTKISQKRPAPNSTSSSDENATNNRRPKSPTNIESSSSRSMGSHRDLSDARSCRSTRSCRNPPCYYNRSPATSVKIETTVSTFKEEQYFNPYTASDLISGLPAQSSFTIDMKELNSDPAERNRQTSRPASSHFTTKNPVPDHHELSARLASIAENPTAAHQDGHASNKSSSNLPKGLLKQLGALKDKERLCREELRKNLQELGVARNLHKQLRQSFEETKAELRASLQMFDKARKHNDTVVPPTQTSISEAAFAKSLQEVRRQWYDSNNRTRIRATVKELENKAAAQYEVKSNLKSIVIAQKAQLNELQTVIKARQEEIARDASSEAYIESLLSGLKDFGSEEGSGTISPVESMVSDPAHIDGIAE
jgi:hypothetical protein